ncbi:hypothetical protein E5206_09780 [Arthrobacter sp. PAMC25564]|uniref:hypothetical protein n=1 Tax=Arthrobacter sp. PAMC25564 TaxID=2565366 RepID=UPI0010A272BF|nr:hypothetical protein [Arthrobacter sp. PAMC25564]QCB97184.1 hypothetical protein E5206_09780 [Arthrobacter sp. PAMC25564]
MPEPGVEVVWGALERALRKAGHDELWLQFRPRGSKDVFDAVQAAVQVANQEVEDAGWGDEVFTEGVSDSDAGPVALMSRVGTEEGVRAWFAVFARHLQALGLSGKVTAAPTAFFPDWLSGEVRLPRQLTAFVSYQTNDLALLDADEERRAWHVPAALTAKVADAATAWGRFNGADVYLQRYIHQTRSKNPDVGSALAGAAAKFAMARVTYLRSQPRRLAWASLGTLGRTCYGVMDDTVSWQVRLAQVTRAMAAFPADTDLAFVQYSNPLTSSWQALSTARPAPPYVKESDIRYNRHLNKQYIPDAHGLQLLTDAHLANANNLSDWIIEPLGEGKHLVQAKDLESWYATIDPDPETLAKARADFGGMILTPEIIAANPPPWR